MQEIAHMAWEVEGGRGVMNEVKMYCIFMVGGEAVRRSLPLLSKLECLCPRDSEY